MKYFLDTNTCIYFLKNSFPQLTTKLLSCSPQEIKIPSLVAAELLFGAEKSQRKNENRKKVERFLEPLEIIDFDYNSAEFYAELRAKLEREGRVIGPNDMIIAATVLANGGKMVTNNVKEFERVRGLIIEDWSV